jgi:hypothetical protein
MMENASKSFPSDTIFLIFSLAGTLMSGILGAAIGISALISLRSGEDQDFALMLWGAIAFGFVAACGLPAVYYGLRRKLAQKEPLDLRPSRKGLLVLALFPLAIFFGFLAFSEGIGVYVLGPLAQLLAASIPVVFVINLITLEGLRLPLKRIMSQFLTGLWIVPPLAFVLEAMILIPTALLLFLGVFLSDAGERFLQILQQGGSPNMDQVAEMVEPLVTEPWFLIIILGFIAIGVPLVEEALKTMVIWPWLFRGLQPMDAFIGGVIGGAGYALFEALLLFQPGSDWLVTMIGRSGATFMHAFTTGLTSWGLAKGFRQKQWGKFLLAFGLALGFHGLWNASVIGMGLISFLVEEAALSNRPLAQAASIGFPLFLVLLSTMAALGLPLFSRRMKAGILLQPAAVEMDESHPNQDPEKGSTKP